MNRGKDVVSMSFGRVKDNDEIEKLITVDEVDLSEGNSMKHCDTLVIATKQKQNEITQTK